MKKQINSHYIQKGLLKRIFPNAIYEFKTEEQISKKKTYENVASSKKLFGDDYEYTKWIEKFMNDNLENDFIKIVNRTYQSKNEIEMTLEEAFLVRRYYAMTWIRMNLDCIDEPAKAKVKKMIEEWTIDNYQEKYKPPYFKDESLYQFFINESTIKFIRHDDHIFINNRNLFVSIPFNKQSTNYEYFLKNNIQFPGYIAPFSKNLSIAFINTFFIRDLIQNIGFKNKSKPPFRLNISNKAILHLLMINAKVKDENKKIKNSLELISENEYSKETNKKWMNSLAKRDPQKTKYIYKVQHWKSDWLILQAHSINEYEIGHKINNWKSDHSYIFGDNYGFKNFLKNIVDIEKYVAINKPKNIEYWTSNEKNKIYHTIWEILLPDTIKIIENIIKKIK